MSRSQKKNPFCGNNKATSEKQDKRIANRIDRRVNKEILNQTQDEGKLLPKKSTSNKWTMDKDGKHRFDPDEFPKGMRK
nr:hypothetical protein [uncultured Desulfobacter sp.]